MTSEPMVLNGINFTFLYMFILFLSKACVLSYSTPARSYPSSAMEKAFAVTCPTGTIPSEASDEFLET